jgi:hypothetical protein
MADKMNYLTIDEFAEIVYNIVKKNTGGDLDYRWHPDDLGNFFLTAAESASVAMTSLHEIRKREND